MRVLQLLSDTDPSVSNLAALDLHHRLSVAGYEIRTLALAPGRRGGLERDVPPLAPARRSFAAAGQVSVEARWSDLVLLHGERTLTFATSPGRMPRSCPAVVALWEPLVSSLSRWSYRRRALSAACAVVVSDPAIRDDLDRAAIAGGPVRLIEVASAGTASSGRSASTSTPTSASPPTSASATGASSDDLDPIAASPITDWVAWSELLRTIARS